MSVWRSGEWRCQLPKKENVFERPVWSFIAAASKSLERTRARSQDDDCTTKRLEKWRFYKMVSWNNICRNLIAKLIYVQPPCATHIESIEKDFWVWESQLRKVRNHLLGPFMDECFSAWTSSILSLSCHGKSVHYKETATPENHAIILKMFTHF